VSSGKEKNSEMAEEVSISDIVIPKVEKLRFDYIRKWRY